MRDLEDETAAAEFAGWMEAQGYTATGTEYDWDDMADAFCAGMESQRRVEG